jgi:hypothetical protein
MTINNLDAFVGGLWDWSILDGCFGHTRIKPTDVDGLVERNGWFLFLEAKGPKVPLKQGQKILLERLAENPHVTVIVIWGDKNNPEQIMLMNGKSEPKIRPCDTEELRRVVSEWYQYADRRRTK